MKVYPRVGGGNASTDRLTPEACGLSPRGRGKPVGSREMRPPVGSIPAWAGETRLALAGFAYGRVYPRVGGGNPTPPHTTANTGGLSPRGRGKPYGCRAIGVQIGSIPAWAGETGTHVRSQRNPEVYPRVGGGNCSITMLSRWALGLSPRGRGKLGVPIAYSKRRGSIPAWAGETRLQRSISTRWRVYPRVGGGNPNAGMVAECARGLSPRGRGKPVYERR